MAITAMEYSRAKNGKLYAVVPEGAIAEGGVIRQVTQATGMTGPDWTDSGKRNGFGRAIMQRVREYVVEGLGQPYNGNYRIDAEDARSMGVTEGQNHEGSVVVYQGTVQRAYLAE